MKKICRVSFVVILIFMMLLPVHLKAVAAQVETGQEEQETAEEETEEETEEGQAGSYNSKSTFGIDQEFDELSGSSQYFGSSYRSNYYLDLEKPGLTDVVDSAANGYANSMFSSLQLVAMVACVIVYFCLDFSLADTVADLIMQLQNELMVGVFEQLWLVAFVCMAAGIVGKLFKKAFAEILKDLAMVVFVTILSILLMSHTKTILTVSTNLTKSISNTVFTGLDTAIGISDGKNNFAISAAGALWSDMVHEPWLTLEFGSFRPDEEVIKEILSLQPGSADRQDLIKDISKETNCFDKSRGWGRIGMLYIYAIPCIMKALVFIVVGLLQFLGQFLVVFVILLAAVVLILAIIPFYGMKILQKWLQMFVDVHLSMILLSFLMAIMIWLNKILYSFAGTFGWFISLIFQTATCIILAMNFKTVIFMLLHPRNGMNEANRMMRQMLRRGGLGFGGFHFNGFGRGYHGGYSGGRSGSGYTRQGEEDGDNFREERVQRDVEDYEAASHYVQRESGYQSQKRDYISLEDSGLPEDAYQNPQTLPSSPPDYQAMKQAPSDQEMYELFYPKEETEADGATGAAQKEELESLNLEEVDADLEPEARDTEENKELPPEQISLDLEETEMENEEHENSKEVQFAELLEEKEDSNISAKPELTQPPAEEISEPERLPAVEVPEPEISPAEQESELRDTVQLEGYSNDSESHLDIKTFHRAASVTEGEVNRSIQTEKPYERQEAREFIEKNFTQAESSGDTYILEYTPTQEREPVAFFETDDKNTEEVLDFNPDDASPYVPEAVELLEYDE